MKRIEIAHTVPSDSDSDSASTEPKVDVRTALASLVISGPRASHLPWLMADLPAAGPDGPPAFSSSI